MAPQLSQIQRQTIIALRESGHTVSQISQRTGISRPTIYFWLRRWEESGSIEGHRRPIFARATTPAQDSQIVDAHTSNPFLPTRITSSNYNIMKFLWLLSIAASVCDAYKLLVVFPMPGKSHSILGSGIVDNLVAAGHDVTYVTPFPKKNPPSNLHQVSINSELDDDASNKLNITALLNNEVSFSDPREMMKFMSELNTKTFENPNIVKLLSDKTQKFDAIIAEWLYNDIFSGLGAVYEAPFIWLSTLDPHWLVLSLIDDYPNPAYAPDALSSNVPPFGFKERVQELTYMVLGLTFKTLYFNSFETSEFEKLIGPYITQRGRVIPPFDEVKYNISLILGNSHVSVGLSNKLPQNYKPIGGYHIDKDVKPLPDNLKALLDNAKHGLIYFSMGSNLKSKDLPDVLKKGFLKVLGGLKQTVLWKFEETLPNLPKNVHIVDWAPQQSILAHPNCVLFITHGGLLSTTETIHFGKPVIGIPVFGDQFNNMDRAVKKGYAIRVDLAYDMIGKFEAAIQDALSNPSYAKVAKELSAIYHDRPVSPKKELVHWVEHVARTRGAYHLRSPALNVPFYQKMYLDLAVVILAIIAVLKVTIRRLCCSSKKVNKKKKTN